jgi:hypothetical protein
MADDSLIEEMRSAIRGDRERAEQRRMTETASAPAGLSWTPPGLSSTGEPDQPVVEPEPDVAGRRVGWLARLLAHRKD